MKALRIFAAVIAFTLFSTGFTAHAQQASCQKHHGTFQCDWPAFRTLLEKSQTIAIRNENMDRFTGVQLKDLAKSLGKTTVPEKADLGFEIVSVDQAGIIMGPGTSAIAELRIYAKAPMADHYELVWVEHYEGDPDRPWQSSVRALIDQFEDHLKHAK